MKPMRAYLTLSCLFVLSLSIGHASYAATINTTITFSKKPPLVGIIYLPTNGGNSQSAEIDQMNKQFTTKMAVIKPGDPITFKNSDSVDHNVFANDKAQAAKFDVGLMAPGGEKQIVVDWKENSIVRVGCKIHPKMRTYLAAIDTEHYQVIEFNKKQQSYSVAIDGVPDDAKALVFKIPKYDSVEIDLSEGNSWTSQITKKGKARGQLTINKK